MSKELNSNKLNGKDLINAGIFSAIQAYQEEKNNVFLLPAVS